MKELSELGKVEMPCRINKEVWEISEVIPEFILTDDKFKSFGWEKTYIEIIHLLKNGRRSYYPAGKAKKTSKNS